jgi:hypothetical protein
MDEITFELRGSEHRLSRERVVESVRGQAPEPMHRWVVEVEGKRFPAKQVFRLASGLGRADFNAHQARDRLRKLGFEVVDLETRRRSK